jgi:hypothetical protein
VIEILLLAGSPTSADDADCLLIPLSPDDQDEAARNRADGDEAVFKI